MSSTRSDDEVREAGFDALRTALGKEDTLRFLRLYSGSTGDYTAERALQLGDLTLSEVLDRAHGERGSTPAR
jgi:hypothetical protein